MWSLGNIATGYDVSVHKNRYFWNNRALPKDLSASDLTDKRKQCKNAILLKDY